MAPAEAKLVEAVSSHWSSKASGRHEEEALEIQVIDGDDKKLKLLGNLEADDVEERNSHGAVIYVSPECFKDWQPKKIVMKNNLFTVFHS